MVRGFLVCLQLLVVILFLSCTKDQMPPTTDLDNELRAFLKSSAENGRLDYYILPDENTLSAIPQDPKNPLTLTKVELGKLLFFDTGIGMNAKFPSGMGTFSCASCHIPEAGFRPGRQQGIADGGEGFGVNGESRVRNQDYTELDMDVQAARPLSLLNVAYVTNTFWNGQFGPKGVNEGTEDVWDLREDTQRNILGYEAIETQNLEGVISHRLSFEKELMDKYGYTQMFDEAFPEFEESNRYNTLTGSLAISAYIRTLLANKAPFQEWLNGHDYAMSVEEKKGAILFFGKARCNNCHYKQNLGSSEFHALGVKDLYQQPTFNTSEDDRRNLGRGGFTLKEEDNFKFRVPGLYNVSDSPFFFHGSSARTLEEVVDYKIDAVSENYKVAPNRLSSKFLPIDLTEEQRQNLISFLSISLKDPELTRYKPTEVLSGFCFPNNDPQSAIDLGCK